MSFWKWSRTANSNAAADSSINFQEGQSPRSLNDSARALMAAAAKYRDDMSGLIESAGTATAYTVTTYQNFSTLTEGQQVTFTAHTTNGEGATLNVDGRGAKALRQSTSEPVPEGFLIEGTPYTVTYMNNAWVVHGFFNFPFGVPVGSMMPFVGASTPSSIYVFPYGQAISRTTYSTLYSLCGTVYGAGNGSTTFNLPDLRGRAVFGLDDMGGSGIGRVTSAGSGIAGGNRGASGGDEQLLLTRSNLPNVNLTDTLTIPDHHHKMFVDTNAGTNTNPSSGTKVLVEGRGAGGADYYYSMEGSNGVATVGRTSEDGGRTLNVSVSLNGGVTQTRFSKMPPCIILPYIMRVI